MMETPRGPRPPSKTSVLPSNNRGSSEKRGLGLFGGDESSLKGGTRRDNSKRLWFFSNH